MRAPGSISARRVNHVGLAANVEKEATRAIVRDLIPLLAAHGIRISVDEELAREASAASECAVGISDECDVIVAVGGDGTILKIAGRYLDREIPIVGVKGGRLGCLTEGRPEGVLEMLQSGQFRVQRRMRVKGTVHSGDNVAASISALNDIVIHSTA